jgi:hypothetical protein
MLLGVTIFPVKILKIQKNFEKNFNEWLKLKKN